MYSFVGGEHSQQSSAASPSGHESTGLCPHSLLMVLILLNTMITHLQYDDDDRMNNVPLNICGHVYLFWGCLCLNFERRIGKIRMTGLFC